MENHIENVIGHACAREAEETINKNPKCIDRVQAAFETRMTDIRTLWNAEDQATEELGELCDYGLCLDFVAAGTFREQREPYYRYQLSYGGPSEEFRVFLNGDVEFWFLDWFDGARVQVDGEDAETIKMIVRLKYEHLDRYPEDFEGDEE